MKKRVMGSLFAAGAVFCVLSVGHTQPVKKGKGMGMGNAGMAHNLSAMDRQFLKDATGGSIGEVEYGRLASNKGSNSSVKSFGQMMIRDHSKALQEAKTLASQKGVMVPSSPPAKAKAAMQQAAKLQGARFDAKYKADMIKMHEQDIAKAKHEADKGSDMQVRNLAKKAVKLFEMHLRHARSMKVGG